MNFSLPANWNEILNHELWGNSYEAMLTALVLLLSGFFMAVLVRRLLLLRLERAASKKFARWEDFAQAMLRSTSRLFLFAIFLSLSTRALTLPGGAETAIHDLVTFLFFVQVGLWASAALDFYAKPLITVNSDADASRATTMRALFVFGNILIWTAVALQVLDNWGVKVSALVAGLGVGGIAVGLALQNVLVDVFASLAIVFDKPFVIGDSIGVGADGGTVEQIGLKTTRLKSTTGEQLIFSNSDLLKNRIRNYKRQRDRRVDLMITVPYDTAPDLLDQVSGLIREVTLSVGGDRIAFDRAHLANLVDDGYQHEVVYVVKTADYGLHMDIQQNLFRAIARRFAEKGIRFAGRTTYLREEVDARA